MNYDFSLKACMESVKNDVELYGADPIKELGKSIVRADQDPFFNKTMIEAWKTYIKENNIRWDA